MSDMTLDEQWELARSLGDAPDYLNTLDHEGARIISVSLEHTAFRTHVLVELDDGAKGFAFSYYADELTFTAPQFIGMTLLEAKEAFYEADIAYLRS